MMSTTEENDYGDTWLGLCTPFICFHRKERALGDSWPSVEAGIMETDYSQADSYDSLERLGSIFGRLFKLDSQVALLRSQEAFVKSCLLDREQFNIKIIAKGINNMKELLEQISKEHVIDEESLRSILNGLKLPKESKVMDSVKTITYHFINKLSMIQHDLQDVIMEYDSIHNSTIDEFENMRRRFFNLTLCRNKGKGGIDFSISKADFKTIVNSENDKMVDVIFTLVDDDEKGFIDWGAFELNSGRIINAIKDYL